MAYKLRIKLTLLSESFTAWAKIQNVDAKKLVSIAQQQKLILSVTPLINDGDL